ncbi:hypothetical protein Ahy_A05g022537 [Arachis hypogaea]|uniref:Uncharacterized protein n=1 Tax=Arachis hypogaea TaxID=3818 RepID=A0A445D0Z5_ARAHY|nr:hypothetical protein Ahy_A05g022537 [Arachis hypogaea]
MDMSDLDFACTLKKSFQSKDKKGESSVGGKAGKEDAFNFSFDFNEITVGTCNVAGRLHLRILILKTGFVLKNQQISTSLDDNNWVSYDDEKIRNQESNVQWEWGRRVCGTEKFSISYGKTATNNNSRGRGRTCDTDLCIPMSYVLY